MSTPAKRDSDSDWHAAAIAAWFAWERLCAARNLPEQVAAFTDAQNAMSDLATWLPGYDIETGMINDDA